MAGKWSGAALAVQHRLVRTGLWVWAALTLPLTYVALGEISKDEQGIWYAVAAVQSAITGAVISAFITSITVVCIWLSQDANPKDGASQ
jgi:hypothetical protein